MYNQKFYWIYLSTVLLWYRVFFSHYSTIANLVKTITLIGSEDGSTNINKNIFSGFDNGVSCNYGCDLKITPSGSGAQLTNHDNFVSGANTLNVGVHTFYYNYPQYIVDGDRFLVPVNDNHRTDLYMPCNTNNNNNGVITGSYSCKCSESNCFCNARNNIDLLILSIWCLITNVLLCFLFLRYSNFSINHLKLLFKFKRVDEFKVDYGLLLADIILSQAPQLYVAIRLTMLSVEINIISIIAISISGIGIILNFIKWVDNYQLALIMENVRKKNNNSELCMKS
jgi:hypothetical protein